MLCRHSYRLPERRCDTRHAWQYAERQRQGYVGGIAYALRLLTGPRVTPDGAPINLLAAQGVLENLLDGHADWYRGVAAGAERATGEED